MIVEPASIETKADGIISLLALGILGAFAYSRTPSMLLSFMESRMCEFGLLVFCLNSTSLIAIGYVVELRNFSPTNKAIRDPLFWLSSLPRESSMSNLSLFECNFVTVLLAETVSDISISSGFIGYAETFLLRFAPITYAMILMKK